MRFTEYLCVLIMVLISCQEASRKEPETRLVDQSDLSSFDKIEESTRAALGGSEVDSSNQGPVWQYQIDAAREIKNAIEIRVLSYDFSDSLCSDWNQIGQDSLLWLIKQLEWEHNSTIHYMYDVYECQIQGEFLVRPVDTVHFYMNSGGFISFIWNDKGFFLGCNTGVCTEYFLNHRPSEEEFEQMMNQE